jgi:AcrR family transcriptional regulator
MIDRPERDPYRLHMSAPPPDRADVPDRAITDSRERIIATATVLFANHGYDGTTTRRIAAATGLNLATMAYHVGSKRELYEEVLRRAHQAEKTALDAALAEFRASLAISPVAAVTGLVDHCLDFCVAQPHIPALWMRRWLSDAAEVADLESVYARPLVDSVRSAVATALPPVDQGCPDLPDLEMTVWTVLWSTHGFCRSGILGADGVRRGPGDPAAIDRFRRHLRGLVLREARLPERQP